MWSGCVIMGDLPRWKIEKIWSGRVIMGDLPRWKIEKMWSGSRYNGWPTQVEDKKKMWSGRVIMGDLPRWKIEKIWSGRIIMGDLPKWKMVVSLWWVTYPEKMMFCFFFLKMVSLLRVTYPKIECDLHGKKTWLE